MATKGRPKKAIRKIEEGRRISAVLSRDATECLNRIQKERALTATGAIEYALTRRGGTV